MDVSAMHTSVIVIKNTFVTVLEEEATARRGRRSSVPASFRFLFLQSNSSSLCNNGSADDHAVGTFRASSTQRSKRKAKVRRALIRRKENAIEEAFLQQEIQRVLEEKWMRLTQKVIEKHTVRHCLAKRRMEALLPQRRMKIHKVAFFHCCFAAGVTPTQIICLRRKKILHDAAWAWEFWVSDALMKTPNMQILLATAKRFQDAYQMRRILIQFGQSSVDIDWQAHQRMSLKQFKERMSQWCNAEPGQIEVYCAGNQLMEETKVLKQFHWVMPGAFLQLEVKNS